MRYVLFLLSIIVLPGSAFAQETRVLELSTNAADALVFADSTLMGLATTRTFVVPRSAKTLRLVHAKADTWSVPPVEQQLSFEVEQDSVQVRLDFPYYYQILSVPFGADVLLETPLERRLLGTTPLLYE